jgi:hypothetical protein
MINYICSPLPPLSFILPCWPRLCTSVNPSPYKPNMLGWPLALADPGQGGAIFQDNAKKY